MAQEGQEEGGTPKRAWQDVAQELSHERDSTKVHALVAELNQLMLEEERRKVMQRLGRKPSQPSAA